MENSAAFTWLLTITIGFFAWFGKVSYDKLSAIDEKVETLLIHEGMQKTEIENLKEKIRTGQETQKKKNDNKSNVIRYNEGTLPSNSSRKSYTIVEE